MTTNTIILMLLVSMLALFLLKVPVYISMSLAGCAVLATRFGMKWSLLSQYLYTGVDSFTLLSIPLFLLAAKIMNTGSITKKLFSFCMKVVGWLPGGLGHVNVLCSVIFAGMSGTAVSDAGGLGSIEIKAMNENGFDNDFSCCVTAASSTLGPIIPPFHSSGCLCNRIWSFRRCPVYGWNHPWPGHGHFDDGTGQCLCYSTALSPYQISLWRRIFYRS